MPMNSLAAVLFGVIAIGILAAACFMFLGFLKRQLREEMAGQQAQFLELAKKQFESDQNKTVSELEMRKQAVESTVKNLKDELIRYQSLLRDFEKDRATKYGNLETEIKNTSQATLKLQETTNHLNNILGNVKLRGQWGERMAEDIIRYIGLIEGVNYQKQTKLASSTTKPDYTFFLPNDHKINMDVKFPLDNYLNMVNATDSLEKDRFGKEFIKNVKDRIKELQNREYINPSENTLDFVLLFIPNEQVFGLIHEKLPDLMDEALKQKVVLCSPFTLYAMLTVIRQAYENFRYEKDLKKIIQLIEQFSKIYDTFKTRFEDIGAAMTKLQVIYQDVQDKSFKQLDKKITDIDAYKKGNTFSVEPISNNLVEVPYESSRNDKSV